MEACGGAVGAARIAGRAGAGRLELCEQLEAGATTPSAALLRAERAAVGIPISVMVRPRGGAYVHPRDELDVMCRAIDEIRRLGADAIVIGVLSPEQTVDLAATRELVGRAGSLPVTFHRAFDQVADQRAALDQLVDAGVARVLTSGGAATALEGADGLRDLVAHAQARIVVMAGGRVRPNTARALVARSGVREVHARSELDESRIRGIVSALSFSAH
ncbi:MAG: copper homeostasis protein CutC [Gemmatimonadales bacterium]